MSRSVVLICLRGSGAGICALGVALARFADVTVERTRLGGVWIGTVLLAGATSLPELETSLSAGGLDAANLAVGNLIGSNALDKAHAASALLAVLLMALGLAASVHRARQRFRMIGPDGALVRITHRLGLWLPCQHGAGAR